MEGELDDLIDAFADLAETSATRHNNDLDGSPAARHARAALRRLMPHRIERYAKHLVERCEQEDVDLRGAIPVAVDLALALVDGDTGAATVRWRMLAELAGVADAGWLVGEILVGTDLVPTNLFWSALKTWGSAATAKGSPGVPSCMEVGKTLPRRRPR